VWEDSPQGSDFWSDVIDAVDGEGEYPKIPQPTKTPKDPIVESVISSFRARSARGIEKYGTTLADNPAKLIEWVNHAQEEVMDLCLYLERIKQELSQRGLSDNNPIN
jgi:hypothetical protein